MQILNQIEDKESNVEIYQVFEKDEKFKTQFKEKKSSRIFN